MSNFTLTDDQQAAYEAIVQFLMNPTGFHFILKGYAGTGKSTLVKHFLTDLPNILAAVKLITQKEQNWEVILTATTNKAVEALQGIVGTEVQTIQSYLGLRVVKNVKKRTTELKASKKATVKENKIILVDEASYLDQPLIKLIKEWTKNCKIIYIGDPAQLTPVNSNYAPIFGAGYPEAELTKVMRQAEGNPIIELATAFRHTVNTGEWPKFTPDGTNVRHLSKAAFEQAVINEFTDPRWQHSTSKVLTWTNKRVTDFNTALNRLNKNTPNLQVGDYVICNKFVSFQARGYKCNLKTDEAVCITAISEEEEYGVLGWKVEMDHQHTAFMPCSMTARKEAAHYFRALEQWAIVHNIEEQWIDLRPAYACTINKSQGSTYDRVYIDLDDISKCNSGNNIARLLYVAVSRARYQVNLTGDLA